MMQKVKVFTKGIRPLILLIATFVFAMFQGGFVSWFLFYTFLPFALYSIVLIFYPLTSIKVKREVTKREYVTGDTIEMRITLMRKNRFPLLYIMVEDEVEQPWEGHSLTSLIFVGFKKSIEWTYLLEAVPRGKHNFQGIRLQTTDLLGLCQKKHFIEVTDTIIVFPAFKPLSMKEFDSLLSGNQKVSKRNQTEEKVISGVREYQSGDQLSWINWKATAKVNKMMTNEFEEQKRERLCLVLDIEPAPSLEPLLSFAASYVHFVIHRGMEIGFVDSESESFLPIRKGERQRKSIFYQLAQVKATGQVERNFLKHMGLLASQTTLVVMTTQLTFEKLEEIRIYTKNHAVTCFVVQTAGMSKVEDSMIRESAIKKGIRVVFLPVEGKVGGRRL